MAVVTVLFALFARVSRAQSNDAKPSESAASPAAVTPPKTPPGAESPASDGSDVNPLSERINKAAKQVSALVGRVWALRRKGSFSEAQARQHESKLDAWTVLLQALNERASSLAASKKAALPADRDQLAREGSDLLAEVAAAEKALSATTEELTDLEKSTGWDLVGTLLSARCSTAICFSNGNTKNWMGIEPLVELPIGKSFAIGTTSLADWVNNHDLRVDLAAGVRVWLFRDVVSVSMYISKPLNDAPVRLKGSSFVYPGSSIRRAYPGLALGLLFDSIWIGFDRDELRNGDGQDSHDTPTGSLNSFYPPNETISSAWTVTVALQPVTAFRTAIGTAVQSSKGGAR